VSLLENRSRYEMLCVCPNAFNNIKYVYFVKTNPKSEVSESKLSDLLFWDAVHTNSAAYETS